VPSNGSPSTTQKWIHRHSIDVIEQTLTADFDGRVVTYAWSNADQLTLVYVVSVHKPGVGIPGGRDAGGDPALHDAPAQPAPYSRYLGSQTVCAHWQSPGDQHRHPQ
jgi:hypothetical protein